jgi:hypothetical protein
MRGAMAFKTISKSVWTDRILGGAADVAKVAEDVSIDVNRLKAFAFDISTKIPPLPKWDLPVFAEKPNKDTIDLMLLGNTINFQYTDVRTKERYFFEYKGKVWYGAMGMWAALKNAFEQGVPILDGVYLSTLTLEQAGKIFNKDSSMPMLERRVEILNEVGKTLIDKYNGHFYNLVAESGAEIVKDNGTLSAKQGKLFNNGKGLLDKLLADFPSFTDEAYYKGKKVVFSKRAQLGAAMLYEKFLGLGLELFTKSEMQQLTVFVNYELPKVLNGLGIIIYSERLNRKVLNQIPLEYGSNMEVEIRAVTLHAIRMLKEEIEKVNPNSGVTYLHLDYMLWETGRNINSIPHHLCETSAY